mgnify:CR=1 FL=1
MQIQMIRVYHQMIISAMVDIPVVIKIMKNEIHQLCLNQIAKLMIGKNGDRKCIFYSYFKIVTIN